MENNSTRKRRATTIDKELNKCHKAAEKEAKKVEKECIAQAKR